MKKMIVLGTAMCIVMAFTSCKSSEKAYKKAYEKAQSQNDDYGKDNYASESSDIPVVAPIETRQSTTETRVVDNYDNVPVRRENVSVVNGTGLKT